MLTDPSDGSGGDRVPAGDGDGDAEGAADGDGEGAGVGVLAGDGAGAGDALGAVVEGADGCCAAFFTSNS